MTQQEPTHERHGMEPRVVETFVVLDLDRTLLDTDNLIGLLYDQLRTKGLDSSQLLQDQEFIHDQTGKSFSLLEHLTYRYGQQLIDEAMLEVLQLAERGEIPKEILFCPGAEELLNYLDDNAIPHAVLTYGEQTFQRFKMSVVRSVLGKTENSLPATITSESKKAEWISHTWEGDGTGERFHVPTSISGGEQIQTSNVVIIDDKLGNITSENEHVNGILVHNAQVRPTGSLSTADLAEYLQAGLSLHRIARLQSLNS